jgi:hypothetical protein
MHTHDSNVFAVVVVSGAAWWTFSAVQIRLDRAVVAGRQATVVGGYLHDFRAQFMTEHARIDEEWLTAVKGMKIGAANAYTMNSQKRLARACRGPVDVACHETARFFKHDLLHRDFLDSFAA